MARTMLRLAAMRGARSSLAIVLLAGAVGVACAAPEGEASERSLQDIVSAADFTRARQTIDAIDYLPFELKIDGCHVRAYYMAMELAAENIESNTVYAFPAEGGERLSYPHPDGGAPIKAWSFHVAPVIEVALEAGKRTVVYDRSLSQSPLDLDQWLGTMGASWDSSRVALLRGAVFGGGTAWETVRSLSSRSWRQELTASFEDMPKFRASEVQSACAMGFTFVTIEAALEGTPTTSVAEATSRASAKTQKLVERTEVLVNKLKANGKLSASASFSGADCRSTGSAMVRSGLFPVVNRQLEQLANQ